MEKAEGLLVGRGGETDEVGIEVFQHLRPEVVDGPVWHSSVTMMSKVSIGMAGL